MTVTSAPPRAGIRLAALSVAQVVSWGILYYALIVAAPAVAEETGWPVALITLAFSCGLVTSALAGIIVGRWLDGRSPRLVMTAGTFVGAAGLVVVSAAGSLVVFALGWVVAGAANAAVLYQAAFTVIARRYGSRRRGPMTILTLAGGLASTVFAPVVVGLLSVMDWRGTFLTLAVVLTAVTAPLHWFTVERRWPPHAAERSHEPDHTVAGVLRTRRFWMLEASMVLLGAALFSVTLAVIPLFMEKGLDYRLAAWALGLLGAGQVIGRLLYVAVPHGVRPWVPLALVAALAGVLLGLLALVPGPPWLLVLVGVGAGSVRGALTLVQGSAVADRWGTRNYGSIYGVFAAPITAVGAVAPALGPAVATALGGYAAMALAAAGVALVAAVLARFS